MTYRVHWVKSALDELASTWLRADPTARRAITDASDELDQLLLRDPGDQGESREEGARIAFVPPLGINFTVDSTQHLVTTFRAWSFQPRRK